MSKEKREKQRKARERATRREKNKKFLTIFGLSLAVILIAGGIIGYFYYNNVFLTKPIDDYSAGIADNGYIEGVSALDYVTLPDYKNLSVSRSELQMSEDEWNAYINPILSAYGELSTETGVVTKDGDMINLDYVGSIDGVEFEGGNTGGNGTTLVLGSHSYIEGFEEQLIGRKTGESFGIYVTFPEDYGNEELNGKEALFEITLNGVYVPAEYNDEFVASYLIEEYESMTAEEYKKQYIESAYDTKLNDYIKLQVFDASTVNSYPEKYLNCVKGVIKNYDLSNYNSYNEYYMQQTGSKMYNNFSEYTGFSAKEYEASLSTQGQNMAKTQLVIQAICESENIEVTDADLDAALAEFGVDRQYYSSFEQRYGKGYMQQLAMTNAVYNYLYDVINITD